MKQLLLLGALLACGCTKNGFAAFVVNQDAQSAGSKPGKSYSAEPCFIHPDKGDLRLQSGKSGEPSSLDLSVSRPSDKAFEDQLGQTLQGKGRIQLEQRALDLEKVTLTVQTLQNGVARGNFNARVKGQNPPWEVVGSFEALLQ